MVDQVPETTLESSSPQDHTAQRLQVLQMRIKLLSLFLIAAIVLIAGLYVNQKQRLAQVPSEVLSPRVEDARGNTQQNTATPIPTLNWTFTPDPQKRIVFAKKGPNYDKFYNLEYWITSPNGSNQQKLDLGKGAYSILKNPQSNKVFYSVADLNGTIFAKDLQTNEVNSFTPVKHPQPGAIIGLNLRELRDIAPDESAMVAQVDFWEPCPTLTPDQMKNPPSEGGPCTPEPIPDLPYGFYFIDLKTQQKRYLGDNVVVAGWDLQNNLLYYHTSAAYPVNTFRTYNFKTGEFKTVETSTNFGYWPIKLFKTNRMIVNTGSTGNSGETSESKITLIDLSTKTNTLIDGGGWADIQPFMAVPQDEALFLYEKKDMQNPYPVQGIPRYNLMKYDFSTGQKTQLSPSTASESYESEGVWIDNDHFVTQVNTLEEPYFNNNNYLINVNVKTGEITRLNKENDVAEFIQY